MRIKSFKLFESSDINLDYAHLKDILQSEVFDEFDIETIERDVRGFDDFDVQPQHKFWSYHKVSRQEPYTDIRYSCNLDGEIDSIIIFNISESEIDIINNKLDSLVNLVESSLGKNLVWSTDEVIGDYSDYYDCQIKLVDYEKD